MPSEQEQSSKKKLQPTNYGKYSAMGLQMATIIGLGTYVGIKIDEFLELGKAPVFTIIFSLFSVVLAIYFVVRDLLKK